MALIPSADRLRQSLESRKRDDGEQIEVGAFLADSRASSSRVTKQGIREAAEKYGCAQQVGDIVAEACGEKLILPPETPPAAAATSDEEPGRQSGTDRIPPGTFDDSAELEDGDEQ